MPRENALPRPRPNRNPLVVRQIVQVGRDVFGGARDQNLAAWLEELVDAVPPVADDRRAARGCFEQPDAWRPAVADHVGTRDIQRVALRVVEGAMLTRRQMRDVLDVARPPDVGWILSP